MNERIKEIMAKCNYVVDGTCDTTREQKFAELIVEECASICYRSGFLDSDAMAQTLLYEFNVNNCRNDK